MLLTFSIFLIFAKDSVKVSNMNHQLPSAPGPIGVFDSGYGGLTILSKIREVLPQYDYVYLGDNARAPYGSRSFDVVYEFTLQAVEKLFEMGCHLVVLGCNTASAKALRSIQQNNLPHIDPQRRVLGVIRPTVEAIDTLTKSRHVGVLGTPGTIKSESYPLEIHKLFPDIKVSGQACALWAAIVEAGEAQSEGADYFIQKDINALLAKDAEIDTIILGCTHYPILLPKIRQYVPEGINILAQGNLVGESLKDYLKRHPEMDARCTKEGTCTYFTTEAEEKFSESATTFLSEQVSVLHIELGNNQTNNYSMETKEDKNRTVEVFQGTSWEAELVKGLLESNGIACMTRMGNAGVYSLTIGNDYSVWVFEKDKTQALEIINNRTDIDEKDVE